MNFEKLQTRVMAILKSPKTEWPVIAGERTTVRELYTEYILVLAAISAVAGFIKMSLIGIDMPMLGTYRMGIGAGIGNMLFTYALTLAAVYLIGLVVNMLAPSFGGVKDDIGALKLVAYSYTASWIAGVFQILPGIGLLLALVGSIYSIYLLYLGLPVLMKCPREKAIGYTAVTIVLSMILSFAISFVTSGITGGMGMMPGNQMENSGGFDKDSPGGKVEEWAQKMESASKEMEKAQESGDPKQQQEAMTKMMATALGSDGTVETLAPEKIKSFLPDTLSGYTRSSISAERTSAMGFQISNATASYENGSGNMLDVEITDMGVAKGVMALAGWFGVEQEKTTDTGYEKTYKQGNEFVHEKWDSLNGSGEYTRIVAERFMVKISGSAVDIEVFRDALKGIDLAGLEALKGEGVKKE